jgi:hypothetical protein
VSSDAPEASPENPTGNPTEPNPRVVLMRRLEFVAIAIGGVFIIGGWGIGHQEWARALGWAFAGVGFAIEMVYGRVFRSSRKAEPKPEQPSSDESAS